MCLTKGQTVIKKGVSQLVTVYGPKPSATPLNLCLYLWSLSLPSTPIGGRVVT